ncbi:MAG: hypothetical protein Q8N77_03390 [Nanoarchaeota archaeon]|nr:hypothetical protein [Nanoarchaeota archaeon]
MIKPNITQEVRNYLAKDLSLQKDLQRGILNIRMLAKRIIKEQNLKTSTDAVVSAIRRFSDNGTFKEETTKIESIFKSANVSTKNNIACIALENQSDIQKYLAEVTKITDFEKRETLRMIKGKKTMKIITEAQNIEKIRTIFPNAKLNVKESLGEIRIKTSLKVDETKGVIARISNELMLRDVNISEMIFCVPEIIIYVDEEDLLDAYKSIMGLCQRE